MFFDILLPRACLKIHSHHLHPPLCGIFGPHSVNVAHYASLIRVQSTTKCDAQLSESNFQTRSRIEQRKLILALCCLVFLRKDSTKTFGGDIKHDMQFHRYGSRGTSNELAESILLVMAGNLNKLYSRIIQNFLKSQINARKIKDPAACSGVFDFRGAVDFTHSCNPQKMILQKFKTQGKTEGRFISPPFLSFETAYRQCSK